MKTLEEELKKIRENLTKENYEEMKKKTEELKITYTEKVKEVFSNNEDFNKIIENRFKIFSNNQFYIKEKVKEVKDSFS